MSPFEVNSVLLTILLVETRFIILLANRYSPFNSMSLLLAVKLILLFA